MTKLKNLFRVLSAVALTSSITAALAQEIFIPDPGLNAAVHEALGKPSGPLTEQDLLNLTELQAPGRNISNIVGLGAARNLTNLLLQSNRLANLSIPAELTNLIAVDLSSNPLTNCFFPGGLTNLQRLLIKGANLTTFTFPTTL